MKRIKIAHESPLCMMGAVREVTDYDYFLCHLFDEDGKLPNLAADYRLEMENSRKLGRETILDNSIFELGKAFDQDKFAYWVRLFNPTAYIFPDVLENHSQTVLNYENFLLKFPKLLGQKIGVVQGKTKKECFDCYEDLVKLGAEKIAISFDYDWYREGRDWADATKFHSWMWGRIDFMKELVEKDFFKEEIPLHLLGCALPQEFYYYNGTRVKKFIESLDTSNPVIHGLKGIEYLEMMDKRELKYMWGLFNKQQKKLVDLIGYIPEVREWDLVMKNIGRFKDNVL